MAETCCINNLKKVFGFLIDSKILKFYLMNCRNYIPSATLLTSLKNVAKQMYVIIAELELN